jgi:hypothetical protein
MPRTLQSKKLQGGRGRNHAPGWERVTPGCPPPDLSEAIAAAYLRAAQAYMLISMPTDTSTIFGVFQAILALLEKQSGRTPPCHKVDTERKVRQ